MRRNLESRYALAESVELCLEEHERDYAADEALREARLKLREQLRTVCELAQDPPLPKKGLTGERRKVRDLLVQALVEVHGMLHAWALATRHERVREQVRNAPYRIPPLPDLALRDLARETRGLMEKHWRSLEKAGMEDDLRRAFCRLQEEFERALDLKAFAAAMSGKAAGPADAHDEALNDLIRHIREVVDPLVWRYQNQAPRFVRAYQSARRVVALSGAMLSAAASAPGLPSEEHVQLLG